MQDSDMQRGQGAWGASDKIIRTVLNIMRYIYSVLRFVPNIARGEFINIGIIVGSDEGGWRARIVSNTRHARKIDEYDILPKVMDEAAKFTSSETTILDTMTEDRLIELTEDQRSVLQYSPALPIVDRSTDGALGTLWPILIKEE